LIFDQESHKRISTIIDRLAEKFHSVSFLPHITLSSTPDWDLDKINSEIENIVNKFSVLNLQGTTLQCSSHPYQKLTFGIKLSEELLSFHKTMDVCFGGDYSKKRYPHISFLYSRVDCEIVEKEIANIKLDLPKKVIAEKMALVHCCGTPENWKLLSTYSFI